MPISRNLAVQLVVLLGAAATSLSQEPLPDAAKESGKEWLADRSLEFEAYRFTHERPQGKALAMESRSLLNWSNAERATQFGALFLWTHNGRPEIIACAFGRGQWLRHEFHSLSDEPIIAERTGNRVHRFRPGVEWRDLAKSPEAAESRPLRLAQMRRQAERFRAAVVVHRAMQDPEPAELRLLTQPAYRSPESSEVDVALFLFVQGTDPECVLMLEATSDKRWRYALTRQTKAGLEVDLDGRRVLDLTAVWKQSPVEDSPFFVLTPPAAKDGR